MPPASCCDVKMTVNGDAEHTSPPSGPIGKPASLAVPPAVEPPAVAEPPAVEPPAVADPPATEPPAAEPPAVDPPAVEPPATAAPPALEPPADAEPPAVEPPADAEPPPVIPLEPPALPPSAQNELSHDAGGLPHAHSAAKVRAMRVERMAPNSHDSSRLGRNFCAVPLTDVPPQRIGVAPIWPEQVGAHGSDA